jgi:cancer susceptibility candidate protein 1
MKQWNTEGIDELSLDRSTKLITFQTMRLAPMAFIMSRCSDYPYKSWKLRSIEPKVAILDIVGKRCPYVFQIGPGYVKLIENQAKELAHIVGIFGFCFLV